VLQPVTLQAALRARRQVPGAVVVAGGTEVMPARNRGERPGPLLDLSRVAGFRDATRDGGLVRLGAGVTFSAAIEAGIPVLALAARTVASRQIRNRATLGGAVALADPSADVLAALLAADARIEVDGARTVALSDFLTGPFACSLTADELVTAVLVPVPTGPAAYAKVGARNAMARAVCAVAVCGDDATRTVRVAVAGCGPVPLLVEDGDLEALPTGDPYKRHAARVLTRRALARVEAQWS
jgi:CO/xanthine dehydrogenase FAD-binding subunit